MSILRLIVFQSLWFVFVKYADHSYSYFIPIFALILIIIDKITYNPKMTWVSFVVFSLFLLLSGLVIDSSLLNLGFIGFDQMNTILSPPYMWGIWLIFLPYYQIGFYKFKNKPYLSSIVAFIFAPFSYFSGQQIGNLIITENLSFIIIGMFWAIFFPISIHFYHYLIKEKNNE